MASARGGAVRAWAWKGRRRGGGPLAVLVLLWALVALTALHARADDAASPRNADVRADDEAELSPTMRATMLAQLTRYETARTMMTDAELKLAPPLRLVVTKDRLAGWLPPRAVDRAVAHVQLASDAVRRRRRAAAPPRRTAFVEDVSALDADAVVEVDVEVVKGADGEEQAWVVVDVHARPGDGGRLVTEVGRILPQAVVVRTVLSRGFASVELPVSGLAALAELDVVAHVSLPEPVLQHAASVSVGTTAHGIQSLLAAYPNLTGSGIRICLISDSLAGVEAAQAAGVAPAVITEVKPLGAGSTATNADTYMPIPVTGEAVAMFEIMYAIAPNASYSFASGLGGQAVLAQAVVSFMSSGCNIIVDDVEYAGEPVHWDGDVAVAIDRAVAAGIVYVTAAGNNYNVATSPGVWEGPSAFSQVSGVRQMRFGSDTANATVTLNRITRDPPLVITLWWADVPTGAVANYDLILYEAGTGNILYLSDRDFAEPLEYIDSPDPFNDTGNYIAVLSRTSSDPQRVVHVCTYGGGLTYGTSGGVTGHAAARGAISVGAVPLPAVSTQTYAAAQASGTLPNVRAYSSDGVRTLFFSPYGVQTASNLNSLISSGTVIRNVPTVVAADGVVTTTLPNFTGTSASAAHVAALVALLLQTAPGLTPAQVAALITSTAINLYGSGWDSLSGAGIINVPAAIANITGCGIGSYYDTSMLTCVACPSAGSTSAAGSIGILSCQPCPANTYSPAGAAGVCTTCPLGLSSPMGAAGISSCICVPGPSSTCSAGYYDGLPVAYSDRYSGGPASGSLLSASLDRDCFVRTPDDPPAINVGSTVVDPTSLDSLCCIGRGRMSSSGCTYGCGHTFIEKSSYWTSDNPLHGAICFVNCYWF